MIGSYRVFRFFLGAWAIPIFFGFLLGAASVVFSFSEMADAFEVAITQVVGQCSK